MVGGAALPRLAEYGNPGLCHPNPCGVQLNGELRLPQQEIDDPAAAHVFARLAAVVEDLGVGAASVFEGIGEDGEAVKGAIFVNPSRQLRDRITQPGRVNSHGMKRVAENAAEESRLYGVLVITG